ncbi:uncharacterized protein LOC128163180 [Crassostrea angulata]|uniref:uncharacterized protein LOC128163180 n=1 Tax=Magallana angulata TaxID=2784310 RepID=UPI0022B133E5|nr:uncharacterized protein LOC128163180 [Crassostrea angulata]
MEDTAENSSQLPAYTALKWGDFVANPHLLYNLCPGPSNHREDNWINLSYSRDYFLEFKVNNIEELERLRDEMLTKPILFHVKLEHHKTEHYLVVRVHKTWKAEYAVLVNTRHPKIREVLTHKLLQITQHMQEGKKFCLQLDFGPSMRQWFSGAVDKEPDLCYDRRTSDSEDMKIAIHNYSAPWDCCMNPLYIVGCFPLWLLFGGSCYCIHRTRKCIDDSHEFRNLPVVLITGVSLRVTVRQNMPPPRPPQYSNPQEPPSYQPREGPGDYDPTPPPPYPGNNC